MSIRNLEHLFSPKSIAVIGASARTGRVGAVVMKNLLHGGFTGPIMPVNPKYAAIGGVLAYPDVASLPITPDLAVLCTPPTAVPGVIAALGKKGTKAAIVLTAGLSRQKEGSPKTLQLEMLEAARPYDLRIMGPNCVGLLVPGWGLNASFAHTQALAGDLAFISQSGAFCTAILDYAKSKGIGFSHFISIGDMADIDFGDVLDYLGSEPTTQAILLYVESVKDARKFLSAGRAAARNKPVILVKAGREVEGARAAASHTGALAGSDVVYEAAFRRAGMLRVLETEELFDAVETLARLPRVRGDRLAILTNGGGPGVMATDALMAGGGKLAPLGEETIRHLDAILPDTWSKRNPVDIIGDADSRRYIEAMKIILRDPQVDALLVMHVPVAVVDNREVAARLLETLQEMKMKPNLLTCWLGAETMETARGLFAKGGIASFETPDAAVRAFLQQVHYHRNQALLIETPPAVPGEFKPQTEAARRVIEQVLKENRSLLTEPEAKQVLCAYGVPVVETRIAKTAEEAGELARELGFPVALKILSHEITHKSDVGGVVLDLEKPEEVQNAAKAMGARLNHLYPDARIQGYTVQKMARRPGAHELIVGMAMDSIFGAFLLFGHGGTAVEVMGDRSVELPPLNMKLAGELMARTRVSKLLCGYRNRPAADLEAIALTLVQVSQMVIELPEIAELDINPLLADERGVLALDARIRVVASPPKSTCRLAIRPYPRKLEEWVTLQNGRRLLLRPIRPEDEHAHLEFHRQLTPEDIQFRHMSLVREFAHSQMARFTQIDYDREMAFIATEPLAEGKWQTVGVVRAYADSLHERAEFAMIVRSDQKGRGIGRFLLEKMIRYCRERGLREMVGRVMARNLDMLRFVEKLGFQAETRSEEPEVVVVRLPL